MIASARFLLDTNALSEPGRPAPNDRFVRRLNRHQGEIATAAPVYEELLFGFSRLPRSRRRDMVERFVIDYVRRQVPILPYDEDAAAWHAAERTRLTTFGRPPPFVDSQIAAVAAVNGLILVTRNVSDFRQFQGLEVEDWTG